MADGLLDGHAFHLATAVRGGPDRWETLVDEGWGVGDRPNGGYLLALATRAALEAVEQPHPIAVSSHFLAPPVAGSAELAVAGLRAGRSLSAARVTPVQEQQPRLEALVSAGTLGPLQVVDALPRPASSSASRPGRRRGS